LEAPVNAVVAILAFEKFESDYALAYAELNKPEGGSA